MNAWLLAVSLICLAACDHRPADPARSSATGSAASAAAASAEARSPAVLDWNKFKAKAGFEKATPEEQVLIWETYRDQFLPAIAADQGDLVAGRRAEFGAVKQRRAAEGELDPVEIEKRRGHVQLSGNG